VYQAIEQRGLVWVRLEAGEPTAELALPRFEAEADTELHKLTCGPYDVTTSAGRIVENFLDMAHFGFVHEGWLGMQQLPDGVAGHATEIPPYQIDTTPQGLRAIEWVTGLDFETRLFAKTNAAQLLRRELARPEAVWSQ
jgi:phenylpropionate dioxygenase-like ring-hydroxylating dioxygenase large terminal subunit